MTDLRSGVARPLVFTVTTLLLVTLLTVPARAAWPGREGTVVYAGVNPGAKATSNVPAGLRSFSFGVPGSRAQLTTDPSDRDPQVSPNGRLVVFSRAVQTVPDRFTPRIFVVGIDGSGLRQLTDGGSAEADSQPTFDASGTRVFFVRINSEEPGQGRDIYSIGLDGSGLTRVTSGPADDNYPAASPSGRQIAFVRVNYPPGIPQGSAPHIYSVRPNGSRLRDLTPRLPTADPWDLDFSPSGRVIAFATEGNQLRGDIFTLRSNGGPIRRLTNRGHGKRIFPRPYGYTNPAFSPTGDSLLAVARSGTSPRLARIRLADPDHPRILALSLSGSAPVWAPLARSLR